jgi:hypothetical protein
MEMDRAVLGVYNSLCGSLVSYILGSAEKSDFMYVNLCFAPSALSDHDNGVPHTYF